MNNTGYMNDKIYTGQALVNLFMPTGFFYLKSLDMSIIKEGVCG